MRILIKLCKLLTQIKSGISLKERPNAGKLKNGFSLVLQNKETRMQQMLKI